jgi:hypothetical protein
MLLTVLLQNSKNSSQHVLTDLKISRVRQKKIYIRCENLFINFIVQLGKFKARQVVKCVH